MRPTGRLHIGHYFGALENWVRLQSDPEFDCFYFIADWHALTSDYADASAVAQNTIEITTDYLAAGLDPDKSIIFQQSLVREHAELHLLLSMVTPLGWLERVPTYKEALENVKDKDLHTYGFLGYPCLQTADIVIYSAPEHGPSNIDLYVPVGEDQVSHIEFSREVVHNFNEFYGFEIDPTLYDYSNRNGFAYLQKILCTPYKRYPSAEPEQIDFTSEQKLAFGQELRRIRREIGTDNFFTKLELALSSQFFRFRERLCEPQHMLTQTPRLPGLDGRKMSKSYGNAITLSESDADIRAKTKVMVTDPARKRRTDPGNPDVCPVYDWHKLFSPPPTLEWAANGCRTAEIGCIECKAAMADNLIKWIEPVRARRLEFEKDPAKVLQILERGSDRARDVAQKTMARVREAVFGWDSKRKEVFGAKA